MREHLLAVPNLGAGNLFRLAASQPEAAGHSVSDAPGHSVIELDRPYRAPDGARYQELTLVELDRLTDAIANAYRRDGIRPKDPVAVFLDESVRYLVHYVSLTKLGAIPVFVNSSLDKDLAARFIDNVGAVAVVTDETRLGQRRPGIRYYTDDPYHPGPVTCFNHHDNDPVLIAHTSGTTGVPKAVQFNHGGFFFGVRQQIHADLGARILSALPQSHASAISVLMSSVARGSRVLLATDRDPQRLAAAIERFRPNLFAGFPKVFVDLCRIDLDKFDLSSVARWMSTGDANHERHVRKLVRYGNHLDRDGNPATGSLFIDNFGSSEFGFAMFRQVHSPTTERYGRCIGKPFGWVQVRILDDNDQPTTPGAVGRLALRSPTMTAGYWNNSVLSEKNRVDGYWLTGDLAYQGENGLFYHVDRTSDSIATSQGTIYSCQVEELVLKNFTEVFECSLVATEPAAGSGSSDQTRTVLAVEPNGPEPDLADLRQRINSVLSENGLPTVDRVILKTDREHLGVTGKALKRTMRSAYAHGR